MSPAIARPLLHTVHLLTFVVLLGTGLLLFVPGLRALMVGGYSLIIRQTHRWGGVAFVALPAAILVRSDLRRVFAPPGPAAGAASMDRSSLGASKSDRRLGGRSYRTLWQGLHVALTLLSSLLLTLTGFVLWGRRLLPEGLVEGSLQVHDWLTYAVAAFVAIHLLDVGAASVVTRLQAAAAGEQSET